MRSRRASPRSRRTRSGKCLICGGRTYESVIRVNSQSGKGGIAFLLEREYGVALPRRLQIDFSQAVQKVTDATGKEMSAEEIYAQAAERGVDLTLPPATPNSTLANATATT